MYRVTGKGAVNSAEPWGDRIREKAGGDREAWRRKEMGKKKMIHGGENKEGHQGGKI